MTKPHEEVGGFVRMLADQLLYYLSCTDVVHFASSSGGACTRFAAVTGFRARGYSRPRQPGPSHQACARPAVMVAQVFNQESMRWIQQAIGRLEWRVGLKIRFATDGEAERVGGALSGHAQMCDPQSTSLAGILVAPNPFT